MSLDMSDGQTDGERDTRPIYGPPSSSPEYRHTLSWNDSSIDQSITKEQLHALLNERLSVRAAYHYLSSLPCITWGEWLIQQPDRRLEAARWLGDQYDAIDSLLRTRNV
jgi:hypothetical protein